ncbi:MAG TPA: hypothetical protein VFQ42_04280 [Mycobacterium sp.]|nr:hypothetical protein [Mycobacterium sp.]
MTSTIPAWTVGQDVAFTWLGGHPAYGTITALFTDEDGDAWADVTWYLHDGSPSYRPHRLRQHQLTAVSCRECGEPVDDAGVAGLCGDCAPCDYCGPVCRCTADSTDPLDN